MSLKENNKKASDHTFRNVRYEHYLKRFGYVS